jgi:hypothetical protein
MHWADVLEAAREIVFDKAEKMEQDELALYCLIGACCIFLFVWSNRGRRVTDAGLSPSFEYARGYRDAMNDLLKLEKLEGVK